MSTDRGRGSAQGRSGTGGGGSPGWSGGCAALGGPGGPVHRGCASRCPGAGVSPAVLHSPVPRRCCTARCPGASGDSGASGPAHPRDPVPVTVAVLGAHRCPGVDAGCSPSGAARPGAPGLVGIPVPGVHPGADQLPLHHREGGGAAGGVPVALGAGQDSALRAPSPSSAQFSLAGDTAQGPGWGHPKPGKRGPGCAGPGGASGLVPPARGQQGPRGDACPCSSDVGERGRGAGSREPSSSGRDGHQP